MRAYFSLGIRPIRRAFLAATLMLSGLGLVLVPGEQAGAVTPQPQGWTSTLAPVPPPLPPAPHTTIRGSACGAPGQCVAAGSFSDAAGFQYGLIDTLSNGTWTATTAPEPGNAGTEGDTHEGATLGQSECGVAFACQLVSCPSTTMCVAIGTYQDTTGKTFGLIETLSNGTWTGTAAPEPTTNAGTGADQGANLLSVTCSSTTACDVVGQYENNSGHHEALIDVLSGTTWTALEAPVPADSDPTTLADAGLIGVTCTTGTSCTAVGFYADSASGSQKPLIDVLSGGAWSAPVTSLPGNSGTDGDGHLDALLLSVSCPTTTWCTAVGEFSDTSGGVRGLIVTLNGGSWSGAESPHNSDFVPQSSSVPVLGSVSCPTTSWCTAAGTYENATPVPMGQILTFAAGTWTAVKAPEPNNHATATDTSYMFDLACPTVSFCTAGGAYATGGGIEGLVETLSGGSWTATEAALPNGAASGSNQEALILTVACDSPVDCVTGGEYATSSSVLQGFLDTYTGVQGYWLGASDGGIFAFGNTQFYGSTGNIVLNKPIVGMAATPDGQGYWFVGSDGGVFTEGDAQYWGSTGAMHLNKPVVGMAPTPDGKGYWLVASDGGIFTEGDAQFHGSTGNIVLNKPIVGMAATPDGMGYWLVASDGGIFTEGDAQFYGSTGNIHLNKPIVGMAATPNGDGYWLVASDGGIFSEGNATFYGSTGNIVLNKPIVGMASTPSGHGYWLVATDGGVFSEGDALFYGSTGALTLNKPIVGMAA